MSRPSPARLATLLTLTVLFSIAATGNSFAQTFQSILPFNGGVNQGYPETGLVSDGHGNLFGTTTGTKNNFGTVFELSPNAGGVLKLKTIYTFQGGADGAIPLGSLAIDPQGNLFGATESGGLANLAACGNGSCGTVFELSPDGSGGWQKTTVHQFAGGSDGYSPAAGVTIDAAGNLYGTTYYGGGICNHSSAGCGTVFKISPSAGEWKETIIRRFIVGECLSCVYGALGGVVFDSQGNLYGTLSRGGPKGGGAVYQMTPSGNTWTYKVIHYFSLGSDGGSPTCTLAIDSLGRVFGTSGGGPHGNGVVFNLTLQSSGYWQPQVLHTFSGPDGGFPYAGVVLDAAGNIYGTGQNGGDQSCSSGCGVAFELQAVSQTSWTFVPLHQFSGTDGAYPNGLFLDGSGALYGTTVRGGRWLIGTVFKIQP